MTKLQWIVTILILIFKVQRNDEKEIVQQVFKGKISIFKTVFNYVVGKKVRTLLLSKIVKIQTSLRALENVTPLLDRTNFFATIL